MSDTDVASLEERYEPDSVEDPVDAAYRCASNPSTCICGPTPE